MKKFISLVLALVMALSLTTIAWGATEHDVTSQPEWDTAIAAAGDGDTIKLAAGTYNLGEQGANLPANLTIIGSEGTIVTYFGVAFGKQCNVTIKNCTFKVGATDIGLSLAGKGTYVVENCDFVTDGDATRGSAIYMTALATDNKYTITGCSFDGKFREAAVVIQEQNNPTTFDVTVSGNDFSKMDAGLDVGIWSKDSSLNLTSDVAAATMVNSESLFNTAVANAEPGDIIALVGDVTLNAPVAIDKPITIDENGHSLSGMAAGSGVTTDANGKVTSGTFADAPANVADGYTALKNTDGTYVVVPAVTRGDKFDLYVADAGMKAALAAGAEDVPGLSFTEVAAKPNSDGSGNLAYIAASNGEYFVKTTNPTVADYAVTVAGKTDVLYYVSVVDVADMQYYATAKAFTNFGTKCGQLYRVDTTKEYYVIEKAEAGFALAKDDVSYVVKAGGVNVLVGNEIKTLAATRVDDNNTVLTIDEILGHNWAVTGVKATTTGKTVPTQVTCLNCGAVVTKFYDAATKVPAGTVAKAVPGYEQATNTHDAWFFVEPAAASVGGTVVTPDTDKVESAETFDAGIAMYVGMSVMAAAGSAVVLKKKD